MTLAVVIRLNSMSGVRTRSFQLTMNQAASAYGSRGKADENALRC
jgi:hypothetical protein